MVVLYMYNATNLLQDWAGSHLVPLQIHPVEQDHSKDCVQEATCLLIAMIVIGMNKLSNILL